MPWIKLKSFKGLRAGRRVKYVNHGIRDGMGSLEYIGEVSHNHAPRYGNPPYLAVRNFLRNGLPCNRESTYHWELLPYLWVRA